MRSNKNRWKMMRDEDEEDKMSGSGMETGTADRGADRGDDVHVHLNIVQLQQATPSRCCSRCVFVCTFNLCFVLQSVN